MSQGNNIKKTSNERGIQLALQAIQQDATLKPRRAAATYNISESTLRRRLAGTPYRRDCEPKSMALRGSEEVAIVRHVLKLIEQGYLLRLTNVKEIANSLLKIRN